MLEMVPSQRVSLSSRLFYRLSPSRRGLLRYFSPAIMEVLFKDSRLETLLFMAFMILESLTAPWLLPVLSGFQILELSLHLDSSSSSS